MSKLTLKLLASTEKCFVDEKLDGKAAISHLTMLKNERLSFQLAYRYADPTKTHYPYGELKIEGALRDKLTFSRIEQVPVTVPTYTTVRDDDYLRLEPGFYPDLLIPDSTELPVITGSCQLRSWLFTVEDEKGIDAGEYTLEFTLTLGEETKTVSLGITVIDAMLPEQTLIHTEWFHSDCIASYYNCEIFSERHWELIGNFMEAAVRCGVNMILTPVVTPPLDTAIGGERPTVQLVDVTLDNGRYSFGYEKLDRYVKLALSKGMKYFEISHLFTQWGAKYAPKVMATFDGEYKRIFGWDTDGTGEEYTVFIREFLTALLAHLKELGIDKKCHFHISDEPGINHLEGYMKAKAVVSDILDGYVLMDALSNYDFYENGAVECPIPSNDHIEPFIENNVPNLWTYYCCGQHTEVSNRFIAMPGQRTRVLGMQLFKYNIVGFLQWGFNFWYSRHAVRMIDPYGDVCGDYFVPGGDAFMVYPAPDGTARYTLHAALFYEALQDMRAMQLLEAKIGHDAVVALIEETAGMTVDFKNYPREQAFVHELRERVNLAIAENL